MTTKTRKRRTTAFMQKIRHVVVIVRISDDWTPQNWYDAPPKATILSVEKNLSVEAAAGFLFGHNAAALADPDRRTWAVALKRGELPHPGETVKPYVTLCA